MKGKITAVLLCVALLLTLSVNVSADTAVDVTQPITDTQMMPVTDEITVNVGEGGGAVITEPIAPIDSDISLTATGTVPVGYLDTVNYNTIGGWAYQSNIPNTALYVHIYITNNSTGSQTIYTTLANVYRSDLAAAGYGNGYHGFHYDVSWLTFVPGTYTVKAYAIGVDSPINPQLTNTKTFTVRAPQYNIEYITSNYVEGWIWKPDVPNDPLAVHIYVYKSNGTLCGTYTGMANRYRSDLQNAGKGNGEHGFRIYIDFNSLPEERLTIKMHYVDNSGYHPVFYTGYYRNKKKISLLTMVDGEGYNRSAWAQQSIVNTYCQNLGCSSIIKSSTANDNYYTNAIDSSMYCVISTHGNKSGIEWSMRNAYSGHVNCTSSCTTCFGMYNTTDLNSLSSNYFQGTRCVVLMACETAKGGKTDATNFANVLHSKGVETVVGFQDKIWTYYNTTAEAAVNLGSQLWITKFTKYLSEGYTVAESATSASEETYREQKEYEEKYNFVDEIEDYCGLDSYCVIGVEDQVLKN